MQRERQKRRRREEAISSLAELGFSQRDAARALHHAGGEVNRAYAILLDSSQATNNNPEDQVSPEKVEQLLYLGFQRVSSEAALRLTGGDVPSATQLLLDNQGQVSSELLSPASSSSSPSYEEPSTSSASPEDEQLVSEVLEDIPQHEEDYLDLTLEEESELMAKMKSYLGGAPTDPRPS
ncbi:NEDD8 ultimate buster 1-like [Menidia menidia]